MHIMQKFTLGFSFVYLYVVPIFYPCFSAIAFLSWMQDPKWMQWPILSVGVVMKVKISTKMWSWFFWTFTIFMLWERACVKSEICKIFFRQIKSKHRWSLWFDKLSVNKFQVFSCHRRYPVVEQYWQHSVVTSFTLYPTLSCQNRRYGKNVFFCQIIVSHR